MHGASSLLIRWICSLALIVAAMPVKAAEAPCVKTATVPVAAPKADCGMPCCEHEKPKKEAAPCGEHASKTLACCAEKTELRAHAHGHREVAKASDPCKCEIKSAPSAPVAEVKFAPSGFDPHALVAAMPSALPELPAPIGVAEPGIFGADSGPPASPEHLSDFGRAPPVARA